MIILPSCEWTASPYVCITWVHPICSYFSALVPVTATCYSRTGCFLSPAILPIFTFKRLLCFDFCNKKQHVFSPSHTSFEIRLFLPQKGFIWLDMYCSGKGKFIPWTYPQVNSSLFSIFLPFPSVFITFKKEWTSSQHYTHGFFFIVFYFCPDFKNNKTGIL